MKAEYDTKINARGLSAPGPRLMVESVLAKNDYKLLRVVVSNAEAVEDLRDMFAQKKLEIKVDQVGDEYHVIVEFE